MVDCTENQNQDGKDIKNSYKTVVSNRFDITTKFINKNNHKTKHKQRCSTVTIYQVSSVLNNCWNW